MAGAVEVLQYQVTCQPGVTKANPQFTDLVMPDRTVLKIRVRIPPGPNGVMGFAIGSTGTSVIPYGDGQFIIASDEIIEETLMNQIDSGSWQAIMYNTGLFPHTIYILFTTQTPDVPDPSIGAQPLSAAAISSTNPVTTATPVVALPSAPALTP